MKIWTNCDKFNCKQKFDLTGMHFFVPQEMKLPSREVLLRIVAFLNKVNFDQDGYITLW